MATSEEVLNRGVDQAKAAVAQAGQHFNHLKDDAVRVAQSAADMGRAGVSAAKDRLHDGQDALRDVADRAKSRGTDLLSDIQTHIEENPLQAVAIAAGVGVVLGVLLRRR